MPAIPSSGTREIILGAGRTGTSRIGNQLSNAVVHEVMLFSGSLTDFAIRRMEGYSRTQVGVECEARCGTSLQVNPATVRWFPVDFT